MGSKSSCSKITVGREVKNIAKKLGKKKILMGRNWRRRSLAQAEGRLGGEGRESRH